MKSMKKMLSLLLVAMLLVTAIPFTVSATETGTPTSYNVKYYVHDVGTYPVTEVTTGLPSTVTVNVLSSTPDGSFIVEEALKQVSAETAKTFIVAASIPSDQLANFTIGNIEVNFVNGEVHYTLPVTRIPTNSVETGAMDAKILEKVGSSYVDNGKTIPVDIVTTKTTNPNTETVTVSKWKTGAEIKAKYAVSFEGVTVNVDRTYVEQNQPYICISTSTSSSSSGGSSLGGGSSNTGGSSSNNGGSSSNNGGTGTVAQFKVTFLNVNGVEFYSEYVAANGTIAASADFLNSSVGTKAGYEHIGWKANSGSTKTTNVVLTLSLIHI